MTKIFLLKIYVNIYLILLKYLVLSNFFFNLSSFQNQVKINGFFEKIVDFSRLNFIKIFLTISFHTSYKILTNKSVQFFIFNFLLVIRLT